MPALLIQDDHAARSSGATLTSPAGTEILVAVYGGFTAPSSMTWNSVALTQAITSGGKVCIYYLSNPAIGTYAFAHNGSGTSGCWATFWLKGINDEVNPVRSSSDSASANSTITCNGLIKGDFVALAEYNTWDDNGAAFSGTNVVTNLTDGNASGYTGTVGHIAYATIAAHQYVLSGENGTGVTCWAAFRTALGGGYGQIIG